MTDTEFIYWKHLTPVGIRVEEISGAEQRTKAVWLPMAMQIYGENGEDDYRKTGHFANGAPFLYGDTCRISITHTNHFLAIASLPRTPEATLANFSARTAMGIDAEKLDREQVLKIRDRFLNEAELELIPVDDLEANIKAWTAKEALYKAAMTEGLDFRKDICIESLPPFGLPAAMKEAGPPVTGKAIIKFPDMTEEPMELYCYESEGCCVMLAYSPKCAKYAVKN